MPQAARSEESENARIVLGLLESVERDGAQSQRKLASDLGIALGLVNAYLQALRQKRPVQNRPGSGAPLCLLSDAARLCREVAADRRISVKLLFVLSPRPRRLLVGPQGRPCARLESHRADRRIGLGGNRDDLRARTGHRHRGRGRCQSEQQTASSARRSWHRSMRCPGGFDALVVTDLQATREP